MADTRIESIYASAIVIDEAYVTTSGSASEIDMTAALAAQAASSAAALAAANAAQVTANAAVAKADVQQFTVDSVDMINTQTGRTYTFVARFAGTLVSASAVLDGMTTAVDACSVAVDISGSAVTLAAPLSFAALSAAGTTVSTTVTTPTGVFVVGSKIRITTTSANTAKTFAGGSLGYTRT